MQRSRRVNDDPESLVRDDLWRDRWFFNCTVRGLSMRVFLAMFWIILFAMSWSGVCQKDSGGKDSKLVQSPVETVNPGNKDKEEDGLTVLFFMNPRGRPCQMQDRIINDAGSKITDHAGIRYVKTTVKGDRPFFSRHFVRGLPMLVILRGDKEVHRFTPGIQSEEAIVTALNMILEPK
jgi:hypothetical protein